MATFTQEQQAQELRRVDRFDDLDSDYIDDEKQEFFDFEYIKNDIYVLFTPDDSNMCGKLSDLKDKLDGGQDDKSFSKLDVRREYGELLEQFNKRMQYLRKLAKERN